MFCKIIITDKHSNFTFQEIKNYVLIIEFHQMPFHAIKSSDSET